MKIFVVALNADTRGINERYQEFPKSYKEYKKILGEKPSGNGFHECVNFLEYNDQVYGYFQAWRNKSIRNPNEEFLLISITYKKRNSLSNKIIGVQAGCRYQAVDNICGIPRDDVPPTLYNELKNSFISHCNEIHPDLIVICGDCYDKRVLIDSDANIYLNKFIHDCI